MAATSVGLKSAYPKLGSAIAWTQSKPKLQNPYTSDAFLKRLLQRIIPQQVLSEIEPDLTRFGDRIKNELDALGDACEANPPYLVSMNAWGEKIDQIVTCSAWRQMKDVSAEEGLIAIGYENKYGEFSRLYQLTKLFMYHPSSGLYTCPLAMTDGAAKSIKELKLTHLEIPYKHLTSRSIKDFWTSGQWMTEKKGGSDVANGTETVAIKQPDGKYKLYGYKFFSSATDSDMTLTLARILGEDGEVPKGSQGLSMFFVRTRKDDGALNNIEVMRLKEKLGTRQLPTGELLLNGADAELASVIGRGVASISNMLTITRIHNASASVAAMRRVLSLSRDYSQRRSCFGQTISTYPLHVNTLAQLELETRAGMLLFFEEVRLLGSVETTGNEEDELVLRLLTPIAKLYTGKKSVGVVSEGLESFGGQGYMEDTGLPRLLRDVQVTPIWEGTTNILSLDVLRAIGKSKGEVLKAWSQSLIRKIKQSEKTLPQLSSQSKKVIDCINDIITSAQNLQVTESVARDYAFGIAQATIGALMLEQASASNATRSDKVAAERWINYELVPFAIQLNRLNSIKFEDSASLVYDGYKKED